MTAFTIPKSEIPELSTVDENRFEFKLSAKGKTYSVPKLGFLPRKSGKFIKDNMRTLGEADLLRGLISIECPEAFDLVDALEDDQVVKLSEAWAEASTITVGESGASETS